ncbi:SGNH/GDSL hydrolase family protein [Cryobacterium sp. Y11]|uniref:SGNH/GDSL hydrolase family protein n=1 Tax=Cryobacterium sp. Y11 TaxID=2045016 RepID=UPI000CE330A9|nr:hypothetical protein [Cryobacterium sp. Y11]
MQGLARVAAAGMMRTWAAISMQGSVTVPQPSDTPQAHSPGLDSDRILLLGSGPAAGWGVRSHDLALPGSLARALSTRTRRGADVALIASSIGLIASAQVQLRSTDLRRVDAVVILLGVGDALHLTAQHTWQLHLTRLLNFLERHTNDSVYIYVQGIQPIRALPIFDSLGGSIADRHARSLNAITERVCLSMRRCVFVPEPEKAFVAPSGLYDSTDYRHWAEFLAEKMFGRLNVMPRAFFPVSLGSTQAPQRPVPIRGEGTGQIERGRDARLNHIVALAQQSFGTASALFAVRDRASVHIRSIAGPSLCGPAWNDSISAIVVRARGVVVVPDTLADRRLRRKSYVIGAPYMRFYAGFPIESASGERIGTLGVFDPKPRPDSGIDAVLLRQLALMVQEEMNASGDVTR